MLDLRRLWDRLHLTTADVPFEAFAKGVLPALERAYGTPQYKAWADRHRLSATDLRRLLTDDSSSKGARAYGTAHHAHHAAAMMRLKHWKGMERDERLARPPSTSVMERRYCSAALGRSWLSSA